MYLLTAKEQALDKERKLIMSKKQENLKGSPAGIKWDECPTYPP